MIKFLIDLFMPAKKIFCENCKHVSESDGFYGNLCYSVKKDVGYPELFNNRICSFKNSKNDCQDYEVKDKEIEKEK